MHLAVVSLFPEMFDAVECYGITARALKQGIVHLDRWNPRDFAADRQRTVDDRPYGGGPGMVLMVQPLRDAIRAAKARLGACSHVVYLSPQGRRLTQRGVEELARRERLVFVCGRYEGVDERVVATEIDEEWSVGDYVLSGGEIAAMALIDALVRLLPGALGHDESAMQDSFVDGVFDCPHYTRPEEIDGLRVPDVLLSGNHRAIRRWRRKQALGKTWLRRPDLLESMQLEDDQMVLLDEFVAEYNQVLSRTGS